MTPARRWKLWLAVFSLDLGLLGAVLALAADGSLAAFGTDLLLVIVGASMACAALNAVRDWRLQQTDRFLREEAEVRRVRRQEYRENLSKAWGQEIRCPNPLCTSEDCPNREFSFHAALVHDQLLAFWARTIATGCHPAAWIKGLAWALATVVGSTHQGGKLGLVHQDLCDDTMPAELVDLLLDAYRKLYARFDATPGVAGWANLAESREDQQEREAAGSDDATAKDQKGVN